MEMPHRSLSLEKTNAFYVNYYIYKKREKRCTALEIHFQSTRIDSIYIYIQIIEKKKRKQIRRHVI